MDKKGAAPGVGAKNNAKFKWLTIIFCVAYLVIVFLVPDLLRKDYITAPATLLEKSHNAAVYTIDIPSVLEKDGCNLIFSVYGCLVRIEDEKGSVIYENDQDSTRSRKMIGRVYVNFTLPAYTAGHTITVYLTENDRNATMNLESAAILPALEARTYYGITRSAGLISSIIMFSMAVVGFQALLINGRKWTEFRLGISLVGVIFCFSMLLFSMEGRFLIFFSDVDFWNRITHVAKYMLLFCFMHYLRLEGNFGTYKKLHKIIEGAYFAIALTFSILGFFDIVPFYNLEIIYAIILLLLSLLYLHIYFHEIKNGDMPPRRKRIWLFQMLLYIVMFIISVIDDEFPQMKNQMSPVNYFIVCFSVIFFYVLCYIYVDKIALTLKERKDAIEAQNRAIAKMEQDLLDYRINAYVGQLKPHFIYNTLAAIRGIVMTDPDKASDLVCDFGTFLRGSLKTIENNRLIPFEDELKNIKAYVNIKLIEMNGRFEMRYDLQETDFDIVPLSIQMLIENAITHGIYQRMEPGRFVLLKTYRDRGIYIIVEDNGTGFDAEPVMREIKRSMAGENASKEGFSAERSTGWNLVDDRNGRGNDSENEAGTADRYNNERSEAGTADRHNNDRSEAGATDRYNNDRNEAGTIVRCNDAGMKAGIKKSYGLNNLTFRLYNIMHANVTIQSMPGEGTKVTIYIPENTEGENEGHNS